MAGQRLDAGAYVGAPAHTHLQTLSRASSHVPMFDAMARFDTFLRVERNLAPRTCVAYQYDLTRFAEWLLARDRSLMRIGAVKADDIRDYLAFLQSKHDYRSAAMCRVLSSIRQFFGFCVERALLENSPAEHIRNPKNPKKLPIFLIESDLRRLIDAPGAANKGGYKSARDYCLLVLLGMTGIRLKEIVGLDVGDVDLQSQTIKVYGKGRKERLVPLNQLALTALDGYLRARPAVDDDALFLNRFNSRLSGRTVEKLVREYCLRAGIAQRGVTPHKLRHTFATLLHLNDVDILEIQRLLGHASIVSTQIYTHTNTRRLRTAVDKISM